MNAAGPGKTRKGNRSKVAYLDSALWHSLADPGSHEEFFATWLAIQCGMLQPVRMGVLAVGDEIDGALQPAAIYPQGATVDAAVAEAAELAVTRRQGVVLKPEGGDPTAPIAAAYPIFAAETLIAVSAVHLEARPDAELQLALRRLQWGAAWIELDRSRHLVADQTRVADRLGTVLDCVAAATDQPRFRAAATALATELALRLDAERVSIGLIERGRVRVHALSHSSRFDKRMQLMRGIRAAMQEAIDQRAMVQCPAAEDDPPLARRAQEGLKRQGGNDRVLSIPFERDGVIIGALTAEFHAPVEGSESVPAEDAGEVLEATVAIAGPFLSVQRADERWLPTRAVHSAGSALGRLFGPGYLGRKLLLVAVALLVAFFALYETDYRVSADATLEGAVERVIAAPDDGYVIQAFVRPGDTVAAGQPMAQLDDYDLRLELHAWTSRKSQYEREYVEAIATRQRAEAGISLARIDETDAQIDLIETRLERLTLEAPFDSVVLEGDLSQSLGVAVRKGDMLFRLAPLDGYRVALAVDERDITDIAEGMTARVVFTALPQERFDLVVDRITPVTLAQEGTNAFRVEGQLTGATEHLRPGMVGVGKIDAGERLLIWTWTRRMVHWVRLAVWRWSP